MALLMDIDEDPLTDSSGEGNTGALQSAGHPNFTATAYFDGGYIFDNINDFINGGDLDVFDSATEISFVGWFYVDQISADDYMIENADAYGGGGFLWFRDDIFGARTDVYRVTLYDSADASATDLATPSSSTPATTWTHVAFTADLGSATGLRLYVGGVEVGDSPADISAIGAIDSGAGTLTLGTNSFAALGKYFDGTMDEIAGFIDILTSTEINDIMDNGLEGAAGGVIKTLNGLIWANIKTINGVAKASISTINGAAAQ